MNPAEHEHPQAAQACPTCGEETLQVVRVLGQTLTVARRCRCARDEAERERDAMERAQAAARLHRLRRDCFGGSTCVRHTFAADDCRQPRLSAAMRRYVDEWAQMKAENMGLLLHGPVGSGKTFYAAAIANALMEQSVPALMINFAAVILAMQGMYSGRLEYLERIAWTLLLILDDLGAERQSEYMLEQVYAVVDARYRIGRPLIITTNLPLEEIKYPADLTYCRIYNRVLAMCHPVKVDGPSRRRAALKEHYARHNDLLGL